MWKFNCKMNTLYTPDLFIHIQYYQGAPTGSCHGSSLISYYSLHNLQMYVCSYNATVHTVYVPLQQSIMYCTSSWHGTISLKNRWHILLLVQGYKSCQSILYSYEILTKLLKYQKFIHNNICYWPYCCSVHYDNCNVWLYDSRTLRQCAW